MKHPTKLAGSFCQRSSIRKLFRSFLTAILLCNVTFSALFAQNDGIPRGAQLPYTRYESEDGTYGGGASLQQSPTYNQSEIASEASNQKYVSLPSNGSYVQWTTSAISQGFNLRFSMPDDATGVGLSGALSLYVNGTKAQTINLTSYWAYQYFHGSETEPVQQPGGKTFMRFDEVHFKLANKIAAGSTVKIVKENGDGLTYGVDFIELEDCPAALGAPTNSLSVTAYGAIANDSNDDFAAFNSCIADAASQGKNVYIPAGRFILSDKLPLNVSNMKIQGAGIWETEIHFSTNKQFYGGFMGRASGVEISDFTLSTANNGRFKYDEPNPRVPAEIYKIYKGFMGTYGTNSKIHDVWIEHFECGMWIAGYDPPYPIDITTGLVVSRARIRNNYADGVNFCQGTNNSVVEYSSIRNEGDDGLAMWPNNALSAPQERNNIFRYCTVENTWRAGGIAIFGGTGHQIYRCIIKDGVAGSAIRFTNDFPGYSFEQNMPKIIVTDNYIVSCGTTYDLWDRRRGAIEFNTPQGIYDIEFNNTKIINSQRHAIQIWGSMQNAVFNNTTIDGTGKDAYVDQPTMDDWGGFGIEAQANGVVTFNNVSFNNIESYKTGTDPVFGNIKNHNTGFIININNTNIPLTGITLSPTTLSITEGTNSQLTVAFNPTNATNKNLTWTSSNTAVATIVGSGTGIADVTAKTVGTATIAVVSTDGSFSKTCVVTVTPAVNISIPDALAGEGGNAGVFTIGTSATSSNITVGYTVSGTASGSDYTSSPSLSGSVTLTPSAPSASLTITPVDDSNFEGSETLTLTLQSGSGYNLGGSTTGTVSIADNENPPCTGANITQASTVITIDGAVDATWSNAPDVNISNVILGSLPGDYTGKYKALWTSSYLYLLVTVGDATRVNDSGSSWWEDDVVEIFLDGDNSKGTSYDGLNDFQLGFRWNDANINVGGNSKNNTTGIVKSMVQSGAGYVLEVAIPWTTIGVTPVIGNRMGIEVEIDDDDNSGTRDSQTAAFATGTTAWSSPSVFGTGYITSCTVTNVPVTGVSLNPATASINTGATQQLTATVSPANATNQTVSYSSSNTSVATVSSSGLVTGVAAGTATITVTTQDGGKTATCAVTVTTSNVAVTGVSVSPTTASITVGGTQQLTKTIAPGNATNQNVTWTSSNTTVATVNTSGLVTGVATGTTMITVTTQDGGKTATCTVTVTSTSQTPYPGPSAVSLPGTIEAENFDNGGEGVAYHDAEAANQGGQYRTSEGVDIEVCSEGGYNVGWTNSGDWMEYTIIVGTTGTFNMDCRVASTVSGSFIVYIDGVNKGTVNVPNTTGWQSWQSVLLSNVSISAGTHILQVYSNSGFNLNKITVSSTSNVPVTGVSVSPTSVSITAGGTSQLTMTIAPSNAINQNVTWSSSNTAVATVSTSGLVTAVSSGTATITVTTQDGNKTATCAVTVTSSGVTYYKIKNHWQNTYLYDAGDRVRYNTTASDNSYQWTFEDVGSGQKEIKNRGTGEYMHIENLLGYVQATARTSGWMSSRWTQEDAGNGYIRLKNVWQPSYYIHVENLQNQAQYGTIDASWWSAQWMLEVVSASKATEIGVTKGEVKIMPNPVSNYLKIELNGNSFKDIMVYDITGRLQYRSNISSGQSMLEIDFGNFKQGIYIIRLNNDAISKVLKVVKR